MEEQSWLSLEFSESEVLEGIRLCASDKAPGPNGYGILETMKEDLRQTSQHFHCHQSFEKSFNATFVALIPKKVGANDLRDFRPISLITGVYKIIANGRNAEEGDRQASQ